MSISQRDKPPHGAACNSCGLCCIFVPCPLSQHVFRQTGTACPALRVGDDAALVCGLITAPQSIVPDLVIRFGADMVSRAAATLVGAGIGCDAALEGEPVDQAFRNRIHSTPVGIEVVSARAIFGITRGRT